MKTLDQYASLMKEIGIEGLSVGKFIKAFDITPCDDFRSYYNQKYASIGKSAFHLLISDFLFDNSNTSNTYKDDLFEYESYDNFILAYQSFEMNQYTYTKKGGIKSDGFVVQSSLFEAIAGVIFLNQGYESLKLWYYRFTKLNQKLIAENNIKVIDLISI